MLTLTNKLLLFLFLCSVFSTIIVPINIAHAQGGVYSDPWGRFTVNIPPGWEAQPAQNRTQDLQVIFLPESGVEE